MSFVKLDCNILHSSLWPDKHARDVFITALLMAEPFELKNQTEQISAVSLDKTGWMIPPGWYGFVRAAGVGIAHMAGVDKDNGLSALMRLSSPETESRSPAFDGRRIARIDGGYLILNFFSYRDRDHSAADRMRRLRERDRNAKNHGVNVTPNVAQQLRDTATMLRNVTQAEAEAEAEALNTKDIPAAPVSDKRTKRAEKINSPIATEYPPGMLRFWNAYPEPGRARSSRKLCLDWWRKLELESITDELLKALAAFIVTDDWRREGSKWVAGAHLWLKSEKWRDPPGSNGTHRGSVTRTIIHGDV